MSRDRVPVGDLRVAEKMMIRAVMRYRQEEVMEVSAETCR
jgi:hypothetical protein